MTKKHFIALAKVIREHNSKIKPIFASPDRLLFNTEQLDILADFCTAWNPNFNRELWLDYIAGKCGPSGGKL